MFTHLLLQKHVCHDLIKKQNVTILVAVSFPQLF